MTSTNPTTLRPRRIKEIFGTFRTVFAACLFLGAGVPLALVAFQARETASMEQGVARMVLDAHDLDSAAGLAEIVQNSALTGIRVVDSSGEIVASNRIGEVGEPLETDIRERIEKQDPGPFSFEIKRSGRTVFFGMKDELSEHMVIMSKSPRAFLHAALPPVAIGLILSLGLCILIALRAWTWSSSIHESTSTLDETLAEADRLRADAAAAAAAEADRTIEKMFDAIPHPAYIRTPGGKTLMTNQALRDEIDQTAEELEGESESRLQRILPVDRVRMLLDRKGFRDRGIRGLIISPSSSRLSIHPITLRGTDGHLVLLELNDETVLSVRGDGPETPRGLRMAIELAESEGRLQIQREEGDLIASKEINTGLADLYGATDLAVWAIDENGRTLHWSKAARRFTGVVKRDVPDVEAFSRLILTDEEQRQTLLRWLDGDPSRLSRQLVCRLDDGTPIGLTWNADETLVQTRPGEMKRVTVLWCKTPVAERSQVS